MRALKTLTPPHSLEISSAQVGNKGNQAVRGHLAAALENCKIPNVCIAFFLCNLSVESVQILANALEKNTTIGGFMCLGNPLNHPNGEDYDPKTDEMVKRAIINTKAPITLWNNEPLPPDVVETRRLRSAGVTLISVPSAEKLAAMNKAVSEARAMLDQQKVKLQALIKEEGTLQTQSFQQDHDMAIRISQLELELNEFNTELKLNELNAERIRKGEANNDRLTDIAHKIIQVKLAIEQACTVIAENEKLQNEVEEVRLCLSHLLPAPTAPPPPPEDPNLCGICYERKVDRVFDECGHVSCAICVDRLMQGNKKCHTCRKRILRALPVFL